MKSPRDYGVPHDKWRPRQKSTVKSLLLPDQLGTQMLMAPTGSGKSTIATAIGQKYRVIALMESKVLQVNQYTQYGFEPLMGRNNYRCVSLEQGSVKTCDMCPYLPKMQDCPVHAECIYLEEKAKAMQAQRTTFNYALFLAMNDAMPETAYYVEDECRVLPDLVSHHGGIIVSERDVKEFKLPDIPAVTTVDEALGYLTMVAVSYKSIFDRLSIKSKRTRTESERFKVVERKLRDVQSTISAMEGHADDWYFEDDGEALIVMPLTAQFHAPRLFKWAKRKNLLMSATIGNMKVLARELGIGVFNGIELPHQYPAWQRPIYDLRAPKIGYRTKPTAYSEWASKIADFIHLGPPNWGGVILVNSKAQAIMLRDLLSSDSTLKPRLFVANPRVGTDSQMRQWNHFKKGHIGAINISWSMWQGVSFDNERICIIAKTPFPMMSNYENARKEYNKPYYSLRVAQKLAQGLGRTRRSVHDYNTRTQLNSLVGIADGNWYIVKRFLPKYLLNAVKRI